MAEINLLIIKIQSNFMKNFSTVKKKKDSNSQFIFQMVTKNLLRHDFISELVNEQDYKNWIQDIE